MADKTMMTTETNPHPISLYYQKKALIRVIAKFVYAQWGQQASIPKNTGATTIWSRWANLLAQATPLTEGIDPEPVKVTRTDLRATVAEYGLLTKQSSWLKLTGLSSESDQITDVILDNMKLTLDTLCRNVLVGSASSTTCSNGDPTATYLNKTDIDTVVTNLEGENARMLRPQINAGTGQGTSPIRAAYIGIGHTAQRPRLEAVAGFKHFSSYASQGNIMEAEFCSTNDVRWLLTTNAYVSGGNYHNMIIAEDFFGNVKIDGGSAEGPLIYTPPEATGSGLRRYSLLGWLANYACKILNDNFGHDLISTV
jgi:N4-gp56 family major capsid protein